MKRKLILLSMVLLLFTVSCGTKKENQNGTDDLNKENSETQNPEDTVNLDENIVNNDNDPIDSTDIPESDEYEGAVYHEGLTLGIIENGVYTNKYFGIRLTAPQNWYVAPEEDKNSGLDYNAYITPHLDEYNSETAMLSANSFLPLFYAFEYDYNSFDGEYNKNISFIAERLSSYDEWEAIDESVYYELAIADLEQYKELSGYMIDFSFGELQDTEIAGNQWKTYDSIVTFIDDEAETSDSILQSTYLKRVDDYMLIMSFGYNKDSHKQVFNEFLQGITTAE